MYICLLGGNGFIGSHVLDDLARNGHKILVFDKFAEKFRPSRNNVEYVYGDLSNTMLLKKCFEGADCVIHLASSTLPEESNDNPTLDIQTNLINAIELVQTCVERCVKKLIFISSGGTVYGIPKKLPIQEDHITEPISSYGIVKLSIEKYIALYAKMYGLDYKILRPSNPYGERQDPLTKQGIVSVFLWKILHNQPLDIFGDGNIVRDYIFVSDLSKAICRALEHTGPSRIFNVGSCQGITILDLIDLLKKCTGLPVSINYLPSRMCDVPKIVLDTQRIKAEMDWQPQMSLEKGLMQTWNWLLQLKETIPILNAPNGSVKKRITKIS
ncbi:MAG: NAD-dependent epimerase/dehydratase family protein [Planctomycetes bacterium]|nr:NAD-dependent epimerase/dehydratase family protein [Planctomycetota bacterium]